jgi:hypothetical protein
MRGHKLYYYYYHHHHHNYIIALVSLRAAGVHIRVVSLTKQQFIITQTIRRTGIPRINTQLGYKRAFRQNVVYHTIACSYISVKT